MRIRAWTVAMLAGAGLLAIVPAAVRGGQDAPGFSMVFGWNRADIWPGDSNHSSFTANAIDVDGQVGYPLFVSRPGARCLPGNQWLGRPVVESGSLPPGVALNAQGDHSMGGIPRERGHWIVKMKMEFMCNDLFYPGFTQELRFHITGSGQVVQ